MKFFSSLKECYHRKQRGLFLHEYILCFQETVNIYSMIVDANDNGAVYECQSTNLADDEPLSESIRLSVSCKFFDRNHMDLCF